jgi:hypothetical protein
VLRSGRTGTVHVEEVLEYNQDPRYLRDLLLQRFTVIDRCDAIAVKWLASQR